jgi:hypothetical protein
MIHHGGEWYLFYHRHGSVVPAREWNAATPWDGKEGTDRQTCLVRLRFPEGEPVPDD